MCSLNIKKKLFISNILMLIIPVIISIVVAIIMILVMTGVIRIKNDSFDYDSELFWREVQEIDEETFNSWLKNPDLGIMQSDIEHFNSENKAKNIFMSLYENDKLIYPKSNEMKDKIYTLAQILLDDAPTHTVIVDNHAFYSKKINNYTAVLTCSKYMNINSNYMEYKNIIIKFIAMMFVLVIFIIFITNYFLTKFLLKSIVEPLDILNYGVHQIQLGNLAYHLEYDKQDEFSIVCDDFNNMAQKLRESVDLRNKDEMSRKELIAGISHDLRTPLTSIKAYVEGLIDGIANTPQIQKSYLETIKAKAEDINQIVDKLFLFSKLDIGEFPFYLEKINIGEELATFVESYIDEYKDKGLLIKLEQNVRIANINVDPLQLRNVFINIMENSVKYKDKEYCSMKIACFEQNEKIYITFTDDGPGVTADAIDKIFDIFYRNDQSRNNPSKGSGLGLAISAKIIERFDGHIWAENSADCGLKIIITIPKCK